jgi:pimeloyl-ACP methyl ester carboxylesterase
VLVHGGFVDGSGWQGVYDLLTAEGYSVKIVQNPTLSLEDDVAVTKRAIADCDGPVVLVGHSYGGAVVTEAGTDEKVSALVSIAAFVPDTGESVNTLIADPPPGAPAPPILPPGTASSSLTAKSLPLRSRRMCRPSSQPSWLTRRSRGASTPTRGQSPSPPGEACPAGNWLWKDSAVGSVTGGPCTLFQRVWVSDALESSSARAGSGPGACPAP